LEIFADIIYVILHYIEQRAVFDHSIMYDETSTHSACLLDNFVRHTLCAVLQCRHSRGVWMRANRSLWHLWHR